ncbi:YfhD family protein [Virgibacillus halophilus]|uniref:YfhD family protein n=1 Tax=Tigheibacillus halophilus TaxID=361280 RepID=A0ABU5C7N5_9BACI|nr:YfhD family protein [Virgibacillus halophilus]
MGRDEHRKPKGKKQLSQTPKNLISDGMDVEFSEALADENDKQAQQRAAQADQRAEK